MKISLTDEQKREVLREFQAKGGRKGGYMKSLTPEERRAHAEKMAEGKRLKKLREKELSEQ